MSRFISKSNIVGDLKRWSTNLDEQDLYEKEVTSKAWFKIINRLRTNTTGPKFIINQPFTPIELIKEITNELNIRPNSRIGVFFTIEWAKYLKDIGHKNVVLITEIFDSAMDKCCKHLDIEYKLVHEVQGMFDFIVGNPPYQDGKNKTLYQQFVKKAFELSDIVSMITPSGWVSFSGKGKTFFELIKANGITHYKFLGTTAFKTAQIITVYFICNKKKIGNQIVINGTKKQIDNLEYLPSGDTTISTVIEKVKSIGLDNPLIAKIGTLYRKDAIKVESNIGVKCIASAGRKNSDYDWDFVSSSHVHDGSIKGLGIHKVIFSGLTSIGKLGPVKYAGPEFGCGAQCLFVEVKNKKEAINLIEYLESKIFRACLLEMKSSVCSTSRRMLRIFPRLDTSDHWSDKELYEYFKLTPDEISYIESIIK
jgi:hypothetical protein